MISQREVGEMLMERLQALFGRTQHTCIVLSLKLLSFFLSSYTDTADNIYLVSSKLGLFVCLFVEFVRMCQHAVRTETCFRTSDRK